MGAAHACCLLDFLHAEAVLIFHQNGIALALGQLVDELPCQSVAVFRVVLLWFGQHQAFRVDGHRGFLFSEQVDAAPLHDGHAEPIHIAAFYRRALLPKCDDGFLNGIRRAVGIADDALGGPLHSRLQSQDVSFELFGRHTIRSFAIISWKAEKSYNYLEKEIKKATKNKLFGGFIYCVYVCFTFLLARTVPFEWVCRFAGRHGE